ncbi:hypothetical protein [Kitasatospora sp. NPDC057223]|uniref:hypothetical protein n=1 Tax=Kitasatospora sp. NPDC057223 TaxID=3346055 RepID=UPI003628EA2A
MATMDDETKSLPTTISSSDAEAHFRRGCQILEEGGIDDWDVARAQFEEAARHPDPSMLWRIADVCQWVPTQAAHWMSRAVLSESRPGGITTDRNLLRIIGGDNGGALTQAFSVAVESDNHDLAVAALTAAAENRLWAVLEDGRELPPEEAEEIIGDTDLYNPNYVGIDPAVPRVWLDCKGMIFPHMARTVLLIVADELRKAGIQQAHLFTPER